MGCWALFCAIPSSRVVELPEPRRHRREDGRLVSRVYFVHNNVRISPVIFALYELHKLSYIRSRITELCRSSQVRRVSIRVCNRRIRRKLTIGHLKWRDKVAPRPRNPVPRLSSPVYNLDASAATCDAALHRRRHLSPRQALCKVIE